MVTHTWRDAPGLLSSVPPLELSPHHGAQRQGMRRVDQSDPVPAFKELSILATLPTPSRTIIKGLHLYHEEPDLHKFRMAPEEILIKPFCDFLK